MKSSTCYVLAAALACSSGASFAESQPRPMAADGRIRHITYNPNDVVRVVGTYGYQTSIEFDPNEEVKAVTLGDTIAWQTVPYQNRLFLKPVEASATTNLTVVTTRRTYYFELRSGKTAADATYVVRFRYPEAFQATASAAAAKPQPLTASRMNIHYAISGKRKGIWLEGVFDDGQFTYFAFKEGTEIPAIYVVNHDGSEGLVNVRREGAYMVVERTARKFALRVGKGLVTVSNRRPEPLS